MRFRNTFYDFYDNRVFNTKRQNDADRNAHKMYDLYTYNIRTIYTIKRDDN